MPRTNYVTAWADLKDMITALRNAGILALDPGTLLNLMFNLEHTNVDWSNLNEILQHLKSPEDR